MILRKLAAQVLAGKGEFAPGIPAHKEIKEIPHVHSMEPAKWHMSVQLHEAERAGTHLDLRIIDHDGNGHSWAIPKANLPKPGEKVLAIRQPTHTKEYSSRKGTFEITEGYGKGKVTSSGLIPIEVVRSKPGHIRFNVYGGSKEGVQEYNLIDTAKGTLLHNITSTAQSGVRGQYGQPIPNSKPDYREIHTDAVKFDDPNEIHQAKLDGAHVTVHLRPESPVKFFSYRPTERATGVIEHTHKIPEYRSLIAPNELAGTVLRGELYGVDVKTGCAVPAEVTGGLLNATVWNSRDKQQAQGVELKPVIFDVVRYKGQPFEHKPYKEKLEVLKEVAGKIPRLKIPPMASAPDEKAVLFSKIKSGNHPDTDEGIVIWKLNDHRPTKAKFRPDVDAVVVGVTPGEGKHTGRIGALQVRLPGKDAVTNVGTGLSDKLREEIAAEPQSFIGRVAKVRTQQIFPSGRMRAPSFSEWHIEKGKQEMDKAASDLNIHAYVTGPSGAGKTTYVKKNYPADKYHIIHSDKYAEPSKKQKDRVIINWDKALDDARKSGKPVVIDAMHANRELMQMAENKLLVDPGRVVTASQLLARRAKSNKKKSHITPEEKLSSFDQKVRPITEELGFKKIGYVLQGHETITNKALDQLKQEGHNLTTAQRFRLIEANKGTDKEALKGLMLAKKHSPFHYHLGQEQEAEGLVNQYLGHALAAKNTTQALDALGIALHTTQDRWAHSQHNIKPGIVGLLDHSPLIGTHPDDMARYSKDTNQAIEHSKDLLRNFFGQIKKPMGHVDVKAPKYYRAVLSKPEMQKASSAIRMIANMLHRKGHDDGNR